MTTVKRHMACFCEATFDADIPETADLGADPEVEQLILDGSFMSVTCPACGKRLSPEYPFHLTGVRILGDIFLVPERDRAAYLRGGLDYPIGAPARVCVGFPELAEKVLIAGSGLDDRVIEIMKYYLLTGPAAQQEAGEDREVVALYRGLAEGKHVFNIMGLKDAQIGVAKLAESLYARIAADVETRVTEDPFRDFCVPPWVSLRRAGESRS